MVKHGIVQYRLKHKCRSPENPNTRVWVCAYCLCACLFWRCACVLMCMSCTIDSLHLVCPSLDFPCWFIHATSILIVWPERWSWNQRNWTHVPHIGRATHYDVFCTEKRKWQLSHIEARLCSLSRKVKLLNLAGHGKDRIVRRSVPKGFLEARLCRRSSKVKLVNWPDMSCKTATDNYATWDTDQANKNNKYYRSVNNFKHQTQTRQGTLRILQQGAISGARSGASRARTERLPNLFPKTK